jgi:uncharacterized NAD(P)/FAD-binding protein YdhS
VPENPAPPRVAVIGGGFCGAFFAAQLAAYSTTPLAISVIEPRPRLGGGVAYSSEDPAHRINVPASRMTLFPERPNDFDDWVRQGDALDDDPEAIWQGGAAFPRRAAFGRYVAELIASRQKTRPHAPITHIRGRAIAVRRQGRAYRLTLQDDRELGADMIILATSHPPPGVPSGLATALAGDTRLIADPWAPDALAEIPRDAKVTVVGSGLTMADVVASLDRRGHRGQITAFSRRGQLSRGHAQMPPPVPFERFKTLALPVTALGLLREVRQQVEAATDWPWQSVFDDLRANGQSIWQRLDIAEQRRFLRHLRVYWDTHRYRIAPQAEAVLQRKRQDGSLCVLAATLRAVEPGPEHITLAVQPRHQARDRLVKIIAERVVVTTGPDHGSAIARNPILASMAAQGLITSDPLGLGLAVDASSHAVGANGVSVRDVFVVGPLARGRFGELMGLPQVAEHPNAVAAQLAKWAATASNELFA